MEKRTRERNLKQKTAERERLGFCEKDNERTVTRNLEGMFVKKVVFKNYIYWSSTTVCNYNLK